MVMKLLAELKEKIILVNGSVRKLIFVSHGKFNTSTLYENRVVTIAIAQIFLNVPITKLF